MLYKFYQPQVSFGIHCTYFHYELNTNSQNLSRKRKLIGLFKLVKVFFVYDLATLGEFYCHFMEQNCNHKEQMLLLPP